MFDIKALIETFSISGVGASFLCYQNTDKNCPDMDKHCPDMNMNCPDTDKHCPDMDMHCPDMHVCIWGNGIKLRSITFEIVHARLSMCFF